MPFETRVLGPGLCLEFFRPRAIGVQVPAVIAAGEESRVKYQAMQPVADAIGSWPCGEHLSLDVGRATPLKLRPLTRWPSFKAWRKSLSELRRSLGLTVLSEVEPWRPGVAWISAPSPELSTYVPPHPDRIPGLMRELHQFIGRCSSINVVIALAVYMQFLLIHPFADGNRRTAEGLLVQLLRSPEGLSAVVLQCLRWAQTHRRTELFNAFRSIQTEGDWRAYYEVVGKLLWSNRSYPVPGGVEKLA